MSIIINDNFRNRSPKPLDNKEGIWDAGVWRAFNSVSEALSTTSSYRYTGLTVLINIGGENREYWFKDGTANSNLIEKSVDLSNYYTKAELQTPGSAEVHWDNITNAPDFILQGDNISLLTNDAGYITSADLPGVQNLSWVSNSGTLGISGGNSVVLDGRYSLIGHTHPISEIDGLQGALNGKVDKTTAITNGYGITIGGNLTTGVSIELNTSVIDSRYLRKDQSDGNGSYTLTLGGLVAESGTINQNFFLPSLSTGTSNEVLVYGADGLIQKKEIVFEGSFGIANSSGANQFDVDLGTDLRFQGTGDTAISYNPVTNTIIINSVPGQGGGGAVTSFNGRDGAVVPETGDYTTSIVSEGTNLYHTVARVRATTLTGLPAPTNSAILATDTILQALAKAQGQITSRANASTEISINGTSGNIIVSGGAQNLSENRSWSINLATSGVTAGTYPKVTVDSFGRVTAGAILAAGDIPNLPASKITSGVFNVARLGSGTASSNTFLAGDGSWKEVEALSVFTRSVDGLVPAPGGSTTTRFIREDGTWAIPANTTYTNMTASEIQAGTVTTGRVISAKVIGDEITRRLNDLPVPSAYTASLGIQLAGNDFRPVYGIVANTIAQGNHTHAFASITDTPTTLFGYGIVAQSTDYADFYPQLSVAYNDPDWIGSLDYDKLINVPATQDYALKDGSNATGIWPIHSSGLGNFEWSNTVSGSTDFLLGGSGTDISPISKAGVLSFLDLRDDADNDDRYVLKAGDTMSGALAINSSTPYQLALKSLGYIGIDDTELRYTNASPTGTHTFAIDNALPLSISKTVVEAETRLKAPIVEATTQLIMPDHTVTYSKIQQVGRGTLMGLSGGVSNPDFAQFTGTELGAGIYYKNKEEWQVDVQYQLYDVVYKYISTPELTGNLLFICISPNIGVDPETLVNWQIAGTGLYEGEWNSSSIYTSNQFVGFDNEIFVVTASQTSGIPPKDNSEGVVGEIMIGSGLSFEGNTLIATGAGVNRLRDLEDVSAPTPTNGMMLIYNAGLWRQTSLATYFNTSNIDLLRINQFSNYQYGLVPPPNEEGSTKFLRQDGIWSIPTGGGGGSATDLGLSGITSTTFNITSSTGGAVIMPVASSTTAGVFSASDFIKLNAVQSQSLLGRSSAGTGAVGAILLGSGLVMEDGVLSATGGGSYTLPAASVTTRGGIRVGSGLTISGDILSATGGGGQPASGTFWGQNYTGSGIVNGDMTGVGNITMTGNLIANGDLLSGTTSDATFKDNIQRILNPLDKIDQLSGNSFMWNNKQSTYETGLWDYGVIAQEVQEVLPYAIIDRGERGLAVKYDRLIPLLVESIKELKKELYELKGGNA